MARRARVALLAATLATAGCFSKPDFRGDGDAGTCAPRPAAIRPAARTCGAGLQPLPDELVSARRQFFSVGDLDRDGLHDVALFGSDAAGGQHVYISFGEPNRDLDLGCWDHELVATSFFRIVALRVAPDWYHHDATHGTLFVLGLDAADHARIRLEQLVIATDRTFGSPRPALSAAGATAPRWADDAGADPAFIVWRFVESSAEEEVLVGGADRWFTVPSVVNGISGELTPVPNPTGLRAQQMIDDGATHVLVDDGTHLYRALRGRPEQELTLGTPLDGDAGSGDPVGEVFAARELLHAQIEVVGLRVPRWTSPRAALQFFEPDEVHAMTMAGVTPDPVRGPFVTDVVMSKSVGDLGTTLAAVVTSFDGCAPTEQSLRIQRVVGPLDDTFTTMQQVTLEPDVRAVVTAGAFRADDDRSFLVVYPRRDAADPPTHSACYRALDTTCVTRCDQSSCAP